MRTKIILDSSGVIDMSDDITLSLNFSVANIRSPENRNSSFSKTIKLPGNPNNNKLFGHIFEIDIYSNFNPTIKAPCTLMVDDMPNLTGYLQLVNIIRDGNNIEYETTIFGNVGNVFLSIGERLLTDLDMSAYNHTYNSTNTITSWSATVGSGYVYPLIDYGYTNGNTFAVENLFPAIYVKDYIDKIFTQAGYSYTSPFFTSEYFKRLIIPYTNGDFKLTDAEIALRVFNVAKTTPSTYTHTGLTYYTPIVFNSETSDPNGLWASDTFNVVNKGEYAFKVNLNVTYTSSVLGGTVYLAKYSGGKKTMVSSFPISSGGTYDVEYNSNGIPLLAGDAIKLEFNKANGSLIDVVINSGTLLNTVSNVGLKDGDTINMNIAIPRDVKQKDFFKSIINMFNLYLDVDKNNPNNLLIEPRNDFYSSGVVVDWSSKRDMSRPLEIKPIANVNTKKYVYTYKEDKDYYNELYKTHKGEVYGTKTINLNNDFITGETKTELIFSATPLVRNNSTDRLISVISNSTVTSGTGTIEDYNIRILYYGGLIATSSPLKYNGSTITTYPYAGHLNTPVSPSKDISFGVPKEVYFKTTLYTNNNLYNTYYKQFLEEITDKDSKMVTAYMYLNPVDIYKLDFRNTFYIDQHALRLNSISDYNPLANDVCKCEFIKIKDKDLFTETQFNFNGGIRRTV